jgi:hypothetical protein
MIIHSPIISGSLTFADGAALSLPNPTEVSGSFSGSAQFTNIGSDLIPDTSGSYDLGSEAYPFQDLWLVGNTLNIGGIGIGAGIGGINIKNKSDNSPAEIGAKSITIGGSIGSSGSKKFKLNSNNKVTLLDENDDEDVLEVKELILKDTSGAGKNTKLTNDGGKFTTAEVNDGGTTTSTDAEGSLSGSFTGSIQDAEFNGDATFNNGMSVTGTSALAVTNVSGLASLDGGVNVDDNFTVDASGNTVVGGTLDSTGLASLDGGVDVDGAFTVADTSGNVSTSGTLGVTGTSTLGVINASGLLSADAGIDVDGAFTVADSTGNVSTSGTLGVTGTSTLGVVNASGLISADAGLDVDGAFTVADTSGNVSTSGTLGVTGTSTLGVVNASGLISADGGIDVDGAFTVADGTGNVSTSGTLSAGNTNVATLDASGLASLDGGVNVDDNFTVDASGNTVVGGTLDSTGLASLDGGVDVDGAFTVADTSGNVSTSGTLSVTGLTTVGVISGSAMDITGDLGVGGDLTVAGAMTTDGHIIPSLHNTYDLGSTTKFWRDLYLSSGSLYINGIQVLSTDGTDLTFQTDEGESTKILETANDTITLESVNGDITLTATGTGNIELDAPIQINAGKNILSSDGNAINFGDDVSLGVNSIYAANLSGVVSSSAITYTGNNIDVAGDTTIQGNLIVQGTQTILNTATLNIEDKNLLIASGAADSAAANGGGITIDGANATMTWVSADSNIAFNTAVNIPTNGLKLNGTAVTSTAAELNLLDTAVAGTVVNSKGVVYGSAGEVNATKLQVGGVDITSTPAELNLLDDVTGLVQADFTKLAAVDTTAVELNYVGGVTSAIQTQIDELHTSSSASNVSGSVNTIPLYDSNGTAFENSIATQTSGEGNPTIIVAGDIDNRYGGNGLLSTQELNAEVVDTPLLTSGQIAGGNLEISTTNSSSTTGNIQITAANGGEIRIAGADIESATDTSKKILVVGTDGQIHTADGDEDVTFASVSISDTTTSTSSTTGALIVDGGVGIAGALNVAGDVVAYASSDERLKDNIEVISNPIEKVQQLKGVTWDWNDNADALQQSLPNVGVIAQDVEKVLPQLVKDRDNGFKGVDYDKIVGLLIEAIKDQQTQIDELKSKLS